MFLDVDLTFWGLGGGGVWGGGWVPNLWFQICQGLVLPKG